jgi:hypothetical protein
VVTADTVGIALQQCFIYKLKSGVSKRGSLFSENHNLTAFNDYEIIRQGATHFFFYDHSVSDNVVKILSHYVRMNLATVLPWNLVSTLQSPSSSSQTWRQNKLTRLWATSFFKPV